MKDKIAREEALKALNDKNNLLAEQDTVREKVRPIAESYLFTLEFLNALSFLESSLLYIHLNDCLHVVEQLESTFVSSLAKQYPLTLLFKDLGAISPSSSAFLKTSTSSLPIWSSLSTLSLIERTRVYLIVSL